MLREVGLPAMTKVGKTSRAVRAGDPLRLRAGPGLVERLYLKG
jgi:hypothetical protein